MIRALFITKHLRLGGAQRNWTILLPALADRGFEPALTTLEDEGEFFDRIREQGVPVACAGMRSRFDLGAVREVVGTAGCRPEIIVSHDERSHLVGRALSRRTAAPHVAADHGGPGFRLKPHGELVLRLVAPGFAAAVTMSPRRVADLVRRGFRRERIHVVPNGVDTAALAPTRSREVVRADLGLADEAFVAVLVAVLRPEKRVDRFVRAVSSAAQVDRRIRGLVVGYGPEETGARRLAERSGGTVEVLGPRADVGDLIACADVVCLTSDLEGIPYAATEAMALGRPVVAMRAGAMDEVVIDGKTGVLVPAGDERRFAQALVSLSGDPDRAAALGAAGRLRQQAYFDAERMCDAYAELLSGVAADGSGAPTGELSAATTQ